MTSLDNVCGLSNLSCRPGQDVYVATADGSAIDVMMMVIVIEIVIVIVLSVSLSVCRLSMHQGVV